MTCDEVKPGDRVWFFWKVKPDVPAAGVINRVQPNGCAWLTPEQGDGREIWTPLDGIYPSRTAALKAVLAEAEQDVRDRLAGLRQARRRVYGCRRRVKAAEAIDNEAAAAAVATEGD